MLARIVEADADVMPVDPFVQARHDDEMVLLLL
jgi:hypothetical protein